MRSCGGRFCASTVDCSLLLFGIRARPGGALCLTAESRGKGRRTSQSRSSRYQSRQLLLLPALACCCLLAGAAMDSLLLGVSASPVRLRRRAYSRGIHATFHISNFRALGGADRWCTETPHGCLMDYPVKYLDRSMALHAKPKKAFCINAASENSLGSEPEAYNSKDAWTSISSELDAFYRFSRPHTVIGTALSIVSVSFLAVQKLSDISPLFFTGLLEAVVAALFMNIYIVGLNQLFDIEIDKVNKPNLPLASGEYSFQTGTVIVLIFAFMSFFVGWIVGSWPLFWALFISFVLGTAYSINLPFLRWKRFAVVAAMCILAVRAVIVQLAFFLHMQMFVFSRPAVMTRPLIFATAFMSFFSVVIALFKDIPDIDGDRIFGIRSFTVRLGQQKVFWICIFLLEMAYSAAVVVGALSNSAWSKCITVFGHVALASILWTRARSLDLKSKTSITSFYMFIWKLFYAEYLLIPLVR